MPDPTPLTVELETAALHALYKSWKDFNWSLFRNQLPSVALVYTDSASRLGRWVGETRTVEVSRTLLVKHGWGVVLEVLKHEMAHQYVDEVLGYRDETSHGRMFRQVCEDRGIDARAEGIPVVGERGSEEGKILERIAKLLALAESPNEHEAQSAMNAARRLMLTHNLFVRSTGQSPAYSFRHLGVPTGRIELHNSLLANILQKYFFVQVIWVTVWRPLENRRGSVLEVCGTHDNLEMATYVHSFLSHTSEALWTLHKRAKGIRGDRDRRHFLAGVMTGFGERLDAERKADTGRGIVWVGDPALKNYLRRRYPRIQSQGIGYGSHSEARAEGHAAGRTIVLHQGISGKAPPGGRLLGGGR